MRAASEATGESLHFGHRFPGGAWGAFLLVDEADRPVVLKVVWDTDWRQRLATAMEVVETLAGDRRVPRFRATGHEPGLGTWMLVDYLPGRSVSWLDRALLEELLTFSDRLVRDEPPRAHRFSWTAEVERRLLPTAAWGQLLGADERTGPLVGEIERLAAEAERAERRTSDLVHGDLLTTQLLADESGRLAGILDWDAAGFGERAHDLALLFLNCHVQASRLHRPIDRDVIGRLHAAGSARSGEVFGFYLAYHLVEMLSFVLRYNPGHVPWRARLARQILASHRTLLGTA